MKLKRPLSVCPIIWQPHAAAAYLLLWAQQPGNTNRLLHLLSVLWRCWLGGRKGIRPASVKSRLVLPFWYRLTWVVPEKGSLNGCVCVCVCVLLLWPLISDHRTPQQTLTQHKQHKNFSSRFYLVLRSPVSYGHDPYTSKGWRSVGSKARVKTDRQTHETHTHARTHTHTHTHTQTDRQTWPTTLLYALRWSVTKYIRL